MTPELQRIRIAESIGWTDITCGPFGQCYGTAPFDPMMDDRQIGMPIPNYHGSLNACAEMEKTLTDEQARSYRVMLMFNSYGPKAKFKSTEAALCHATSAQRCEAFLRMHGKWEEEG
jgi:hypothetical protein